MGVGEQSIMVSSLHARTESSISISTEFIVLNKTNLRVKHPVCREDKILIPFHSHAVQS